MRRDITVAYWAAALRREKRLKPLAEYLREAPSKSSVEADVRHLKSIEANRTPEMKAADADRRAQLWKNRRSNR
ncbi:MAG: hypothetical protein AAF517_10280 [Planctomycetota bacterium]